MIFIKQTKVTVDLDAAMQKVGDQFSTDEREALLALYAEVSRGDIRGAALRVSTWSAEWRGFVATDVWELLCDVMINEAEYTIAPGYEPVTVPQRVSPERLEQLRENLAEVEQILRLFPNDGTIHAIHGAFKADLKLAEKQVFGEWLNLNHLKNLLRLRSRAASLLP